MDANTQAAVNVIAVGLGGFIAQKLHAIKKLDNGLINIGLILWTIGIYIWAVHPEHFTLFDASNAVIYAMAAVGAKAAATGTGFAQEHDTIT